jgi:hypothetical protein
MDVRTPIGALLVTILAAVAVEFTMGWMTAFDAFRSQVPPFVTSSASPGATTLTIFATTPLPRLGVEARDYAMYAWTGAWPTEPIEATARVGERRFGITPAIDRPIPPGRVEVELVRSGFLSETYAFDAAADTAHKVTLVLFRSGESEARDRHQREVMFYHRFQFVQQIALAFVLGFHVLSLITGVRRRFGRRLAAALFHLLLVTIVLVPAVRILIAFDLAPWVAAFFAGLPLVVAPFGLHPRAR